MKKKEIVFAEVFRHESPLTFGRFNVSKQQSLSIMFIRQGLFHILPISSERNKEITAETLVKFATDGYSSVRGLRVPAPVTWVEQLSERLVDLMDDYGIPMEIVIYGFPIACLLIALGALSLSWKSTKKTTRTSKKQASHKKKK